ncbi:hypothetical protein A2215_03145 [Candidatus Berkelbacteria bacterium RIFOXYA2_FULL_43_10]|uniref:DUF4145 domain-containing protein n=1 Tax=Candidatus Berkelbacteria bacterium RIFOXYA2_FULL_43_10 TaxID=1797472 RepID=A0A1F5EDR0_9BACT|nr:MAG: hypothetical protein A2215_03145 [Candidatus Berkelbacteria bacterium RIFOXYA2_FULL_43_10]
MLNKSAGDYNKGVYNLERRVPVIVRKQSEKALTANDLLQDAWGFCYSRKPDYEKVVSKCCDFLEGYIAIKYFPKEKKPTLRKLIIQLSQKPQILTYKGSGIIADKALVLELLKDAIDYRGQHTSGTGKRPNKDEAEFVLHTTIYLWNLFEK